MNEVRDIQYTFNLRLCKQLIGDSEMDKQILKVKSSLDKGEKDTKKLLQMDRKQDRKIEKCDSKKMKKK
jgi:hypothetical protein